MIPIKIITISKLKDGPWKELQEHYLKLMSPFVRMDLVEIKPEKFQDMSQREKVLEIEAEKVRKQIPEGATVVVLEATGKTYASEPFSSKVQEWADGGKTLCFILGGPLGLSDEIKKSADHLLSFSPMTFPHDMARVMLLEQLYRASTISAEKTYHY